MPQLFLILGCTYPYTNTLDFRATRRPVGHRPAIEKMKINCHSLDGFSQVKQTISLSSLLNLNHTSFTVPQLNIYI